MFRSLIIGIALASSLAACGQKRASDKSSIMSQSSEHIARATVGTGCFWCTEAIFQQLDGVQRVSSGYSGGHVKDPTYKQVCTGTTGHAECLDIYFDTTKIRFDDLLEIFFQVHDPTTLNRQGNDIGPQYRSVIFYHDATQKALAEKYIRALNESGAYAQPIVTSLEAFEAFYPAEDYHKDYFNLHGNEPYCQLVVRPKVEKFQKVFKSKLKH